MDAKQLRNSILQMAIEGKLVPQDPNDEPASVLLDKIRQEKKRLVKEGKLKKKDLVETPISDVEKPFDIPNGWEWIRWGALSETIQYGYNAPAKEKGRIKMVRISDIQNGRIVWETTPYCDINEKDIENYLLRKNDILFARTGGTVGKSYLVSDVPNEAIYAGYLIRTRYSSLLCAKYLKIFMESSLYWAQLKDNTIATAQPNCNGQKLSKMILPLPPLAEQHRIVAKLEEILPMVDEYGKAQEEADKLQAELPDKLRKSILQEAIQGKLVPQDPNYEPASILLNKIRQEKKRLVKEGVLKKKDLVETPISDDEKPFEIPERWEWCRLGDICLFLSRGKSPKYSEIPNQYPVFAQKCNLKDGGISLEQARFLDPETLGKWKEEYKLRTDDILVNSTGTGTVCRTRLFHAKYLGDYPFTLPDSHVSVVRTFDNIDSAFYYYIFNSKHIQDYWEDRLAGSTNQKELYIGTLQDTIIPIPPLTEQHRIVAKIEELFNQINKIYE